MAKEIAFIDKYLSETIQPILMELLSHYRQYPELLYRNTPPDSPLPSGFSSLEEIRELIQNYGGRAPENSGARS